jgi:hypothetical protein
VQPDLGGARARRRTGRSAGRARVPGPPSHHRATHPTCYLEDLYAAKQWRGGDVANRLIAAVYASDGFGPASSPRSTTPRHAPYATPSPSDIVFGIPALSLPEDSARCGRRRRLPRPIRCAAPRRRSPCLASFPQVHWSTPERESQRQGRCNSLTKINAGLHGTGRRSGSPACGYDLARGAFRSGLRARSSWACIAFAVVSRRIRRIDQSVCVPPICKRGWPSALRGATASVHGDALGIAGRQVFHRYALFVPSGVLSGWMAMRVGNGRVNERS